MQSFPSLFILYSLKIYNVYVQHGSYQKFFFLKGLFFFGKKTIVDSIQGNYVVQWGRGNMGILLIKTMTSSSYHIVMVYYQKKKKKL